MFQDVGQVLAADGPQGQQGVNVQSRLQQKFVYWTFISKVIFLLIIGHSYLTCLNAVFLLISYINIFVNILYNIFNKDINTQWLLNLRMGFFPLKNIK